LEQAKTLLTGGSFGQFSLPFFGDSDGLAGLKIEFLGFVIAHQQLEGYLVLILRQLASV